MNMIVLSLHFKVKGVWCNNFINNQTLYGQLRKEGNSSLAIIQ